MDGENNGSKPYEQMDDLGVFPYFFGSTPILGKLVWVPLTIKGVPCHWESCGVRTVIELSPSPILAAMDFSITPLKFDSEFTPEKCWERKTIRLPIGFR